MQGDTLIFVYKADSGLLNALKDGIWKVASPDTYPCNLCAITYGLVSMRREWKDYVRALPYEVNFTYEDKLRARWPGLNAELPAAFILKDGSNMPEILIPADEMNWQENIADLRAAVNAALMLQNQDAPLPETVRA